MNEPKHQNKHDLRVVSASWVIISLKVSRNENKMLNFYLKS